MRWNETTLWERDRSWLHAGEAQVDAGGDSHMDESGGRKRTASEAGLTSEDTTQGTSQALVVPPGGRRPMGDVNMGGDEGDGQMVLAARGGGGAGSNPVSKETPISNYPSLSYGLPETHTTILPWTGWLSVAGLDKSTPAQLKIRMNAPWDMLDVTTQTNPGDANAYSTKGFYASMVDTDGRQSTNSTFPVQFGAGTTQATERPAWREYWAQIYDYYTVLGCEYEIILYNPLRMKEIRLNSAEGRTINGVVHPSVIYPYECGDYNTDVVVGTQVDTYSDTATTTGNVMPLTEYEETRQFKNIQWTPVPGGKKAVIRGTYKPGQAKRNIVNDGDVKTWTATGTTLPNLKEILTLNFWNDPFFNGRFRDTFGTAASTNVTMSATGSTCWGACNMEINLKYIVQFKDLKLQARYPNSVTAAGQNIVQNLSNTITDTGNPMQRWT